MVFTTKSKFKFRAIMLVIHKVHIKFLLYRKIIISCKHVQEVAELGPLIVSSKFSCFPEIQVF